MIALLASGVVVAMLITLVACSEAAPSLSPPRRHLRHLRGMRDKSSALPPAFAQVRVVGLDRASECARLRADCAGPPCRMQLRREGFVRELCLGGPTSVLLTVRDKWARLTRVSVVVARALDPSPLPEVRHQRPLRNVAHLLHAVVEERPVLREKDLRLPSGLLVCHDSRFNYRGGDAALDTYWGGLAASHFYTFLHWNSVALLVFFAHETVSFPPQGWIKAARRNSCRAVLGTVMVEDEEEALRLFGQPRETALKLAHLAQKGGFDGWLVNVEIPVGKHRLANVTVFLETLQRHGFVILFDCLTASLGEHRCQNSLTSENRPWLDVVDGLFLNYHWTPAVLPRNNLRIFVGTDAFGRGTFGGGGFASGAALQLAKSRNLSVAFFAPAWSLEIHGHEQAHEQLWNGCPWRTVFVTMEREFGTHSTMRKGNASLTFDTPGIMRVIAEIAVHPCLVSPCGSFHAEFRCQYQEKRVVEHCDSSGHMKFAQASFTLRVGLSNSSVLVEIADECATCHVLGIVTLRYSSTAWPCAGGVLAAAAETMRPVAAPSYSHFSVGKGDKFFVNGRVWRNEPWANRALQSRLPALLIDDTTIMQVDFEHAFSFGSSLHLVATSSKVHIPLYALDANSLCVLRLTVLGEVSVFLNRMPVASLRKVGEEKNGWNTFRSSCCIGGLLTVTLPAGQAWLGFLSIVDEPCIVASPIALNDLEGGCLVSWQLPVSNCHAFLDIIVRSELMARLVPEQTGSSFLPTACADSDEVKLHFHSG